MLYVVATPLGTLSDLSPRAQRVLTSVAAIACEDTRTTRRLLSALDLASPPLIALHAHNEKQRAIPIAERALTEDLALVSDAGTPGLSDPGGQLVAACHELGVEVRSVPGPSALAAAIAVSGFLASPLTFLGFPPRKGRDRFAAEALGRPETLVIYEAPTRVADLLTRMGALLPARQAVLAREISKRHEQVLRGPLSELPGRLPSPMRGECVVVVGPGEVFTSPKAQTTTQLKDIASVLAERWGVTKKEAYRTLLNVEKQRNPSDA
jgi:16S rRNA (cytidine1402-2'-O)-methyltransferase